jgi:hypothetical protein
MRFRWMLVAALAWPAVAGGWPGRAAEGVEAKSAPQRQAEFAGRVEPFIKQFCHKCHAGSEPEADVHLDRVRQAADFVRERKTWQKVLAMLRAGEMPPKDQKQPTPEERAYLVAWIADAVDALDCSGSPNPGRVTIRRLNRFEYRNSIRDLVLVDYEPAADFPADDVGYGFDNIGDVLALPPVLMEKYLAAAEEISNRAILTGSAGLALLRRFRASELSGDGTAQERGRTVRVLSSQGETHARVELPRDGQYLVRVVAFGDQAGGEKVRMGLSIDGREVKTFTVGSSSLDSPTVVEEKLTLGKGSRRIGVAFLNDYYNPSDPNPRNRDRNLIVRTVEVQGPLDSREEDLPASHKRIIFANPGPGVSPGEAAARNVTTLASRAYRRPATEQEVARLVALFELSQKQGESFEQGMRLALQAVLCSPHFLFRVEGIRPGVETAGIRHLDEYELASRLSYFLWGSMPDDELFRHAWEGSLRRDGNLEKQARRMLADSKSRAFVTSFAGQWLQLRLLETLNPDRKTYPAFDEPLRTAMRTETEMFFEAVFREDRSVLEFLDADYTFVNDRLARHYGLPGVTGSEFRRVSFEGGQRGGLLGQASILTVTSNPNRTSPVKRGKWVLENLLASPPPEAPADVPDLEETRGPAEGATLRQRMEQHRSNPACASCHQRMDPLGFALENYDGIGSWRAMDGRFPVDAAGELPTGEKFQGPKELKNLLLAAKKDDFTRCLVEKMLTYALGRGLEYYDRCAIDQIAAAVARENYRSSVLIVEIIKSDPFQKRSTLAGNAP